MLSLPTGEEATPRLIRTFVKRIGFGTHLKHNRIDAHRLKQIELICQVGLHLFARQAHKLPIDTLYPSAAHLAFRAFKGILCRYAQRQEEREEEKED